MQNKPLVIDVESKSVPNGDLNKWANLSNTGVFINDIKTPQLSNKTNIGALVSGIPTAFARVDLFKSAIDHVSASGTKNGTSGNLIKYYVQLIDEWKGLIACMGLDYPNISVKSIKLVYSDGQNISSTTNPYEPVGAFGNMLLERAERWSDPNRPGNVPACPFINIIKYNDKVVAATAPESLLFTSTGYRIDNQYNLPWIDIVTGKFTDPLRSGLNEEQTATLHAYIHHINNRINKFTEYYKNLPTDLQVNYSTIQIVLNNWLNEIAQYAQNNHYSLSIGSTPPVSASFEGPFADLFTYEDLLYGVDGVISETPSIEGMRGFDPKKLLLEDSAKIARIHLGPEYSKDLTLLQDLPVYVLKAQMKEDSDTYAFFALPLSTQGLNVYGKTIGALVGMGAPGSTVASELSSIFDSSRGTLEVTLTIKTETGKKRKYTKSYNVGNDEGVKNSDILLWPNFISKQWNSYFLYSELPHNGTTQQYSAHPFVGDTDDPYFRIMTDENKQPIQIAEQGHTIANNIVNAELLVSSTTAVADNGYKYEIFRSDKPFKGVRLMSPTGNDGGYLIVNYSSDPTSALPRNFLELPKTLRPVSLGVDFGSTNTSIAYSSNDGEKDFKIENQRVSLLGATFSGNPNKPRPNQVFFFQGRDEAIPSNAIKSVLTLHDPRRLPPIPAGETDVMRMSKAVIGGFPCLIENLPVEDVSEDLITLKYDKVGLVQQVHNMKWNNPAMDNAHKQAFLHTLMLQVYAQLFVDGVVPTSLRWSYPSSMGITLLRSYQMIWDSLANISPVMDINNNYSQFDLEISQAILNINGPIGGNDVFGDNDVDTTEFGGGFGGFDMEENEVPVQTQSVVSDDDAFGSFGGGFGGFGEEQPQATAKPAHKVTNRPDLKPDDPNRVVNFSPQPLFYGSAFISLTEATSVANFTSVKYGNAANQLTLCFDIGGSTTDISALYLLTPGLTMIKQNSLRFAAQRVSRATACVPGFEDVLNKICAQFNIPMLGLNVGPKKYTPETAPFYFDQIVDRLKPEELKPFYQLIQVHCPQLMWVNMYVTGLVLYYAGQIASKLIEEIAHTNPNELIPGSRPSVQVTFAGKGSRLLQWLTTTDPTNAKKYYETLFMQGFGGMAKMKEQLNMAATKICLPDINATDIKYEVSKGLAKANTTMLKPSGSNSAEIIGESGFTIVQADNQIKHVSDTNTITAEMIENIGVYFNAPTGSNTCKNFVTFCGTFYNAAKQLYGMKIPQSVFINGFKTLNIQQYVQNMPEYRQAKDAAINGEEKFDFVAPIIILEGMKFYESTLLNALK